MSDNARLKAENDLLGKQIEAQQEYYKTLSANYADMAAMRHDIANHIFTIRAPLLDGKSGKAMQYAAKLEKKPHRAEHSELLQELCRLVAFCSTNWTSCENRRSFPTLM